MDIDSRLFVIIASRVPAIWDVIGPLALNPQPLPPLPVEVYTELNPQPLPPGPPPEAYGAVVGRELVRLQWQADKLGQQVAPLADWEDDPCPTYPRAPKLPPWLPPVPDPNPAWLDGYYLGLACALAAGGVGRASRRSWARRSSGRSRRSAVSGLRPASRRVRWPAPGGP